MLPGPLARGEQCHAAPTQHGAFSVRAGVPRACVTEHIPESCTESPRLGSPSMPAASARSRGPGGVRPLPNHTWPDSSCSLKTDGITWARVEQQPEKAAPFLPHDVALGGLAEPLRRQTHTGSPGRLLHTRGLKVTPTRHSVKAEYRLSRE